MDTTSITTYSKSLMALITELSTVSLIAIAVAAALFFLALRSGKERVTALILALYLGYALYQVFPYRAWLAALSGEMLYTSMALFGALVFGAYLLMLRVLVTDYEEGSLLGWLDAALLSLGALLLLAVCVYTLFPLPHFSLITPTLTAWITDPRLFFWWLFAPLIVVFVTARR